MNKGYMGKILKVDLSSGSIEEEVIPDQLYEQVLSGAGLAVRLLYDRIPRDADPLGPDNTLGLVTGLLTGTGAYMMGRWMAVGKSPLTGGWGEANAGGNFAPAIKKCGYDGIFFRGISERPVYLKVVHGRAELADASHLWGKDVVETENLLKKELGQSYKNVRVVCIGPAGENQSLISGIVNEGARIAARSGLGAVMGSKRLKAVALVGNRQITSKDPEGIKKLSKRFARWMVSTDSIASRFPAKMLNYMGRFLRVSPVGFASPGDFAKLAFRAFGTIVTNVLSSENGDSPVKNWKGAGFKDFPISTHADKLNPGIVIKNERRKYHCYSCPLGCGGIMDLEGKTRYDLKETHKPEYETMCAFGALILNNDIDSIYLINDMLNRAGMDVISAGSTVAFAMECFEQGILTQQDLGDMDLKWGNADAVIGLLQKMIYREGIGDVLADGVKKASERLGKGADRFAIHAGGQELPMHDSRNDPGWGVCYSMEPTPGRHTNYSYQFIELFAMHRVFKSLPSYPQVFTRTSRNSPKGKEVLLSAASKYCQICNGAGGCFFGLQMAGNLPIIKYLNAATGWNKTPEQYLEVGERIQHLRQAFNIKHGKMPGKDFKLHPRAAGDPPLEYGPLKGVRVPISELNRNFARAMGWDEMGKPLKDRLMELGLSDVAEELY
jgi:aldehyde:ferredoxin oxidoreductase